ncbi:TIGR01841 family phasin [Duganella sp. FT135W]|uniref:TIGR01841 family phasin n=1 Tax=Duganella flavida TaxID=2692175 RepID=A0A6L8KD84_9BURK|nr:phasin family protein [Duganella flavida]MYM23724.1 TIGR01841 family phasin [Duganella flavida]
MYPYSKSVSPAVRTHLEAQNAFLNDVSKSIFNSFQQFSNLNMQLAQTLLEETTIAGQQLLTADQHPDVAAVASRAQPVADKLRAYQQHISRLAADTQVDLSRVTEEHVKETTQTANALAQEVARTSAEDSERNIQKQEESIRQFTDPFNKNNGKRGNSGNTVHAAGASMQSGSGGNAQGGSPESGKNSGKPA